MDNGYTKARMFHFIRISELKDMTFLNGKIAALKDAIEQWSTAAWYGHFQLLFLFSYN
jgi:hypothetical protein